MHLLRPNVGDECSLRWAPGISEGHCQITSWKVGSKSGWQLQRELATVYKEVRMEISRVQIMELIIHVPFLGTLSQVLPVRLYEWTTVKFQFLCRKRWRNNNWKKMWITWQIPVIKKLVAKLNEPFMSRACCSVLCSHTIGSHWVVKTPREFESGCCSLWKR